MEKEEAKSLIHILKDPKIKNVGDLFLNLNLELVACGDQTKITRKRQDVGHIDLLFKDKEVKKFFFMEVSTKRADRAPKINQFFTCWEEQENIEEIQNRFELQSTYKIVRIYLDLSGKLDYPASVDSVIKRRNNYFLNDYDFNYFKDAYDKVGVWSRNDFFSYLNIKPPERTTIRRDAIQFFLGEDTKAYVFVETAKNLLKYSYIFRRKKDDKGFQRVLEKGRIGGIAKKIEKGNIFAFPNSILLSCPDESKLCHTPKERCECPCHVEILLPNYFCACRIIDGQHRLLSFTRLKESYQESHFLPVVIFENIKLDDEMKTFIEINSGQKKIDRNLILILLADFDWDINTNEKEFFEKIAVEVVKKLNSVPPLKGKIFLPEALAKRKGKITLNTLVTQIIGNNFIGPRIHLFQNKYNDVSTPYKKIKELFVLAKQKLPQYTQDTSSFIFSNKGLRILFRLAQIFERNRLINNLQFKIEEFYDDLSGIFSDILIEQLEDYYGEGGANRAVEEIFKVLKRRNRQKYRELSTDLRKLRK